jgi:hypothetical protein
VIVAVVGRRRSPPVVDIDQAAEVGRLLAQLGHTVVTGGRGGIMEAAQRGAFLEGGVVVAITPGEEDCVGPATLVIRTGLPVGVRNLVTATCCAAMVALPGSHGTWQEMSFAVERGVAVYRIGAHDVVMPGTEEATLWDLPKRLTTERSSKR